MYYYTTHKGFFHLQIMCLKFVFKEWSFKYHSITKFSFFFEINLCSYIYYNNSLCTLLNEIYEYFFYFFIWTIYQ